MLSHLESKGKFLKGKKKVPIENVSRDFFFYCIGFVNYDHNTFQQSIPLSQSISPKGEGFYRAKFL